MHASTIGACRLLRDDRSDFELVAIANAGDASGLEALYDRHRDWVVATAYRLTGDREMALDSLQETFLYVIGCFPGFELRAQFRTFLYPIVHNTAVTAGRRRQREHRARDELAKSRERVVVPPAAADASRAEALDRILAALSPGHREVLVLRFVDGLDLQEIAVAIGVPLGTVKSRLHHALRALREDEDTKSYFER